MPSSLRLWIGTVVLLLASLLAAFFGVFNMVFSDIFGFADRVWSYVYVGTIYLVFGFLAGLIGPTRPRRWVWILSAPAVATLVLYTFSEFQNILIHAGFVLLVPLASTAGVRAGARLRRLDPRPKAVNHGSMSTKRVIAAVATLILLGAAFMLLKKAALAPEAPEELTRERAIELLGIQPGACVPEGEPEQYRSCEMDVAAEGLSATVTITYDGFFDDSVKASRTEAFLEWREGAWYMTALAATHQCWPERGHQDFSTELCV